MLARDGRPDRGGRAAYLANAGAAADSGGTAGDIQAVMIAVAPVVGTAQVVWAGGNILRALGLAIAVADSEMAGDSHAGSSSNRAHHPHGGAWAKTIGTYE